MSWQLSVGSWQLGSGQWAVVSGKQKEEVGGFHGGQEYLLHGSRQAGGLPHVTAGKNACPTRELRPISSAVSICSAGGSGPEPPTLDYCEALCPTGNATGWKPILRGAALAFGLGARHNSSR